MFTNIDEIKAKAEMLLKNSRETQGEFVQVYNNGFEDGVNFVLQNLQQCSVGRGISVFSNAGDKRLDYRKKYLFHHSCQHEWVEMEHTAGCIACVCRFCYKVDGQDGA